MSGPTWEPPYVVSFERIQMSYGWMVRAVYPDGSCDSRDGTTIADAMRGLAVMVADAWTQDEKPYDGPVIGFAQKCVCCPLNATMTAACGHGFCDICEGRKHDQSCPACDGRAKIAPS